MATVLFQSPADIAATTLLGGNVDPDKYTYHIEEAQEAYIEPLLGTELYDKMIADFTEPTTYTGLYATLYTEFMQPITKFQAMAYYIREAPYSSGNGGIFKHVAANSEVPSQEEIEALAQTYSNRADLRIIRFNKWIGLNVIPEYKTSQDEVDASKTVQSTGLWWFGDKNTDY